MLEVTVLVERIDASRLSEKANENAKSNYNLNVSLSEKERTPGELVLNYVLELTSTPPVAKIAVSGSASLKGTKDEVQAEISAPDDSTPPKILVTVYERTYGLIYMAASGLKVPRPMPNLVKKAP